MTAYFARRSADPHLVADLTADTFVAVITGFGSFDPRKGTPRAWVFGIARRVYAAHCEADSQQQHKVQRLAGRRDLDRTRSMSCSTGSTPNGPARMCSAALAMLPERDRAVIELVDLAELRPKEAAAALGLPPGTVRMRLCGPAPACAPWLAPRARSGAAERKRSNHHHERSER